jgi:hypothetical protein
MVLSEQPGDLVTGDSLPSIRSGANETNPPTQVHNKSHTRD